MTNGELVY